MAINSDCLRCVCPQQHVSTPDRSLSVPRSEARLLSLGRGPPRGPIKPEEKLLYNCTSDRTHTVRAFALDPGGCSGWQQYSSSLSPHLTDPIDR
jgi:hypothetical protein